MAAPLLLVHCLKQEHNSVHFKFLLKTFTSTSLQLHLIHLRHAKEVSATLLQNGKYLFSTEIDNSGN